MKFKRFIERGFSAGLLISLISCVSTEIVDPEPVICPPGESEAIVLNLSAPEAMKTRADNDHVLRYSARLFEGSPSNMKYESMQRQEILEGNKSEYGQENQLVFYLAPGTQYTIYVFADYIPKNLIKESEEIPDYYYNTRVQGQYYEMYTNPGVGNSEIGDSFFNNDNYDCFYGYVNSTQKQPTQNTHSITLDRMVSKVRFVNTSNSNGVYSITGQKLTQYHLLTANSSVSADKEKDFELNNKEIVKDKTYTSDNNGETELFYYYTFANVSGFDFLKNNIKFTITGEDYNQAFDISDINVRQNFITTVKGRFLPIPEGEEPPVEDNPGVEHTVENSIVVNAGINNADWGQIAESWPSN